MATTATPTNGLFADNLICEALIIRFPKIYVFKNPQGGRGTRVIAGPRSKSLKAELTISSFSDSNKIFVSPAQLI